MADDTSGSVPAGWYEDPENPGRMRWWDGNQWAEAQTPPPPPAPSSMQPPAPWGPGGMPVGPQPPAYGAGAPDPWLWQSIVATVLCCLPPGIYAVVKAADANSAIAAGDLARAHKSAASAKKATLWAVGLGIAFSLIYAILAVIGIALDGTAM